MNSYISTWVGEDVFIFDDIPAQDDPTRRESIKQRQTMTENIQKLHELYNAGHPLHTKQTLRKFSEELDKFGEESGHQFCIKGFDGNQVVFKIETGRIPPIQPDEDDMEYVLCVYLISSIICLSSSCKPRSPLP